MVLAAELALGWISDHESLEYYSLLETKKAKLIELICHLWLQTFNKMLKKWLHLIY